VALLDNPGVHERSEEDGRHEAGRATRTKATAAIYYMRFRLAESQVWRAFEDDGRRAYGSTTREKSGEE